MSSHRVLGITAVLVVILTILTVLGFRHYGLIDTSLSVQLAVGATLVALLIKIILQGIVTKEPEFHKQGYDLCIMTLTTALTGIAAEFAKALSKTSNAAQSAGVGTGGMSGEQTATVFIMLLIFVAALLLTLLTTYNSRRFEDLKLNAKASNRAAPKESYASLFSFLAGMAIFVFNIYVIARRAS